MNEWRIRKEYLFINILFINILFIKYINIIYNIKYI